MPQRYCSCAASPVPHECTCQLNDPSARRRLEPIERAVELMHAELPENLSLDRLAREAYLSPYYFHRVFRDVTSTTPGRFLTALRMAEAIKLLLRTDFAVTRISLEVGYSSLGTFTTQFSRLVGLPPGRLRKVAAGISDMPVEAALQAVAAEPAASKRQVYAQITSMRAFEGLPMLAGIFRTGIPQQLPASCSTVSSSGVARFSGVERGEYQLLVVGFDRRATLADVLAAGQDGVACVGRNRVVLSSSSATAMTKLVLRRPTGLDPPVLCAGPLLTGASRSAAG